MHACEQLPGGKDEHGLQCVNKASCQTNASLQICRMSSQAQAFVVRAGLKPGGTVSLEAEYWGTSSLLGRICGS